MKKIIFAGRFVAIIMLTAAIMTATGCVNVKKINITSFKISSISPEGFKAVRGSASIGIDNQSNAFQIYDIKGVIRRSGTELGTFTMEPLSILAKTGDQYTINGRLSLSDNMSAFELLSLIPRFRASEYVADLYFTVKPKGGAAKKLQFKDIPAEKLLRMMK